VFGLGRQKIAIAMYPGFGSADLDWDARYGFFCAHHSSPIAVRVISGIT
jgi:hypothetical protein